MGKSIRSKMMKRFRTAKRQRVDAMIVTPRENEHHESLRRVIEGRSVTLVKPKNAFKYPTDATAVFPQHEIMKPIDYRSECLPMAQYNFRGNRRQFTGEQAEYMAKVSKLHPQMEVLAGGGAILAKTGVRVSTRQAEILATAQNDPEAIAAAVASPASAADAVAAAVAEASAAATAPSATAPSAVAPAGASGADVEMASAEAPSVVSAADAAAGPAATPAADVAAGPAAAAVECEIDPVNEADHTRVPVVKDTRRSKRTAEHRPRANAVKKKNKQPRGESAAPPSTASKAKEASPVAAPEDQSTAPPSSASAAKEASQVAAAPESALAPSDAPPAPAAAPSAAAAVPDVAMAPAAPEAVAAAEEEGEAEKAAGGGKRKKKKQNKKGAAKA